MTPEQDLALLHDGSPDSLLDICMDYIVKNLDIISKKDTNTQRRNLHSDVILPVELCEKLLRSYQSKYRITDEIANIFKNRDQTRLDNVTLHHARVSDEGLRCFMIHKPRKLELIQCEYLSQQSFDIINSYSERLVYLKIRRFSYITLEDIPPEAHMIPHLRAPHLRHLTIYCRGVLLFPFLFKPLKNLTHLDLSDFVPSVTISVLKEMINLRSLVLYNVPWIEEIIKYLPNLKTLVHLDISQTIEGHGLFTNPNRVLTSIVTGLPKLVSLDISGTNLAGYGSAAEDPLIEQGTAQSSGHVRCDIPGLVSRVDTPLEFLGLYGTHHEACKRHDIPAKVIAGDANEDQLLNAAVAYKERPIFLSHVLSELYYMFRFEHNESVGRPLHIVLDAMNQHINEKHIQISGSATLFYIVKGKDKDHIGVKLKRRIIKALLDAMDAHLGYATMMRNGCLTLCQFKIPDDVLFEYERVVQILLNAVDCETHGGYVQRIAVYLLNSLACQVDGEQKLLLGNNDVMLTMMTLIAHRHLNYICDDVLEVAWSTMWNVTDETPLNCFRFLENQGLELFLACLETFPENEDLLRNMLGLLGNVAEVPELRSYLTSTVFITVLYDLLNSYSDGIEVSYNAAGVLAHIVSDGEDEWMVLEPERNAVLERMTAVINRWDVRAERNINYRSFRPILKLLKVYHTPQCQHWAVWALTNLTSVYPEKYCGLVGREGGIDLLQQLLKHPAPYDDIKELANVVIDNCNPFSAQFAPYREEPRVYYDDF